MDTLVCVGCVVLVAVAVVLSQRVLLRRLSWHRDGIFALYYRGRPSAAAAAPALSGLGTGSGAGSYDGNGRRQDERKESRSSVPGLDEKVDVAEEMRFELVMLTAHGIGR